MRRKLLLADDSITVQRVIELTFADEDLDVSTVGDGDEAVSHMERDRPDIVLADLSMPGRDGYGVAEHVKHTPAFASHTRVVLLTGAFEPVDQERAEELGVDGVLGKPFEPRTAIELVRSLLTKPPREAQSKPPKAASSITATFGPRTSAESASGKSPAAAGATSEATKTTAAAGYPFEPDAGTPRSTQAELDDYFKRLDEALASAGLVASPAVRDMLAESKGNADSASGAEASASTTPKAAARETTIESSRQQRQENNAMSGTSPSAEPNPAGGTLVDAFSALLAAEQGDTGEEGSAPEPRAFRPEPAKAPAITAPPIAAAPATPSPVPVQTPSASVPAPAAAAVSGANVDPAAAAVMSDALIEAVAKRVVDQLGDRIVRDVVNATVVDIAERLVREEIERLKAAAGRG